MTAYTTIVPVDSANLARAGRERTAQALRKAGINRVLLAIGSYKSDPDARMRQLDALYENLEFMKREGFDAGAWLWAFMYDGGEYTRVAGFDGRSSKQSCCPLDPEFREFCAGYVRDIARLSPSLILFDDDLRFGHLDIGLGCRCEKHTADILKRLDERLSPDELVRRAFNGGENRYRRAWLDSMGDSIRRFARDMRAAVDSVDKSIRMGQCACITSWDADGVDADELSRILAGDTRPYLRLIGAPYWAVTQNWGNRLADTIEVERMQLSWCGEDIEVVSEGDVYPRPRWICPASYLECFDTALRSSGGFSGIQKYMLDYTSSAAYETGYLDRHIRNGWLYSELDRLFQGKTAVGARIYEYKHKLATAELAGADSEYMQNLLFSISARAAAANGIPTVYTDDCGCAGILFGENARQLPDDKLDSGLLIDLAAAELLTRRGVDVGIETFGDYFQPNEEHGFIHHDCIQPNEERRLKYHDCIQLNDEHGLERDGRIQPDTELRIDSEYIPWRCGRVRQLKLKDTAEAWSNFVVDGKDISPSFYYYTNPAGQRFAVICADAKTCGEPLWRNYLRQNQIICALNRLGSEPLPAVCAGNPDLYILAKRAGNRLAVGLWNLSPDEIFDAEVILPGRVVKNARSVDCNIKATGCDAGITDRNNNATSGASGRIIVDRLIPYRVAAIEVELAD